PTSSCSWMPRPQAQPGCRMRQSWSIAISSLHRTRAIPGLSLQPSWRRWLANDRAAKAASELARRVAPPGFHGSGDRSVRRKSSTWPGRRFDSFFGARSSSPIVNTEHGEELMSLKDKTVVITGGSRGLGRGLAEAMVAQGARVTVVARNADGLAAVRT